MPVAAFASLALGISLVSLTVAIVGVWMLRREPPDVSDLKARYIALDQEVTDVNDRLTQWMRRESVRKMQEAKQAKAAANGTGSVRERKAALRAAVFGNNPGGTD